MCDIFTKKNTRGLLKERLVWVLGDSNMRAVYKDIIWLLQRNSLISTGGLKARLEKSFMNDTLLKSNGLHRGRDYIEERRYVDKGSSTIVDFMFLTKCLTNSLQAKIEGLKNDEESPDLVVMNSCVWDITRWGPEGVTKYKENVVKLLKLMKKHFLPETLVIWTTTPPVSSKIRGGFMIKQIEFMRHSLRFEIMEGNFFVRQEVIAHGYDVLDIHYYLLLQIHRREHDGIHWIPEAIRYVTNLILTHAALAWEYKLPGNFKSQVLDDMIADQEQESKAVTAERDVVKLGELAGNIPIATAAKKPETATKKPEKLSCKTVKQSTKIQKQQPQPKAKNLTPEPKARNLPRSPPKAKAKAVSQSPKRKSRSVRRRLGRREPFADHELYTDNSYDLRISFNGNGRDNRWNPYDLQHRNVNVNHNLRDEIWQLNNSFSRIVTFNNILQGQWQPFGNQPAVNFANDVIMPSCTNSFQDGFNFFL